jgi:hypothetical protein
VNDNFVDAIVMEGFSATVPGSNVNATRESAEEALFNFSDAGGYSVWHRWVSPTNGYVRIDTFGSAIDTKLSVYRGSTPGTLSSVAENDNWLMPPDYSSHVEFKTTADTEYVIRIDSSRWNVPGPYRLNIELTQPPEVAAGSSGLQANGDFTFEAVGIPGRSYVVQTSPDLVTWTTLPGAALSGERFTVRIPQGDPGGNRFFRLMEQ